VSAQSAWLRLSQPDPRLTALRLIGVQEGTPILRRFDKSGINELRDALQDEANEDQYKADTLHPLPSEITQTERFGNRPCPVVIKRQTFEREAPFEEDYRTKRTEDRRRDVEPAISS
jgi:hypothetical protein